MKGKHGSFFGSVTLGERGQVVIPVKARKAFGLKKGDTLLVLGMGKRLITFIKADQIKKLAAHLADKLSSLEEILVKENLK